MKRSKKFITEKKAEISSVEASTGAGALTGGLVAGATGGSGIKGILGGSITGALAGAGVGSIIDGVKASKNKRAREARKEKTPASKPKPKKEHNSKPPTAQEAQIWRGVPDANPEDFKGMTVNYTAGDGHLYWLKDKKGREYSFDNAEDLKPKPVDKSDKGYKEWAYSYSDSFAKQRKADSTLQKLAGSDIRFYAGKGRGEKPDYSPSTMYHYKAHGKYTSPSLPIGSVSDKSYGKILKKEVEGPKGKKREISTGTYIRPEEAEKYIGAYDKAVKSPHPYRWYPDEAQKEVPRKRNLLEVIMRKKPTKKVVSEEGLKKFISDPEFQKEHKSTLQWMKKNKDKGFTINVG